jgi:hypothetical protein
VGLVVVALLLLGFMPGLLYLAGWGINRYIQKAIGRVKPASAQQASADTPTTAT